MDSRGKRRKLGEGTSRGSQVVTRGRAARAQTRTTTRRGSRGEASGQHSGNSSNGAALEPNIGNSSGNCNSESTGPARHARIDESLFANYTYNVNAKEGSIALDVVHPSWFKFPEGEYVSESDEDASDSDVATADATGEGEGDAAASEIDGDGDESDDDDPAYTGD